MALNAGTKLGTFDVLELVGRGGMGEVYRAKDSKLGREVAIKVLPDEFAQDEERLRRFQREAKVLASLNHPNIAAIYGLEQSDNTHYLVLELVPGQTLADRIARGPIPVEEALEIATKIAEALEEAHEQGIVHRDLKPANIKITEDDKVKVLDFGLAKAFTEDSAEGDAATSMSPTITRDATRVGVILGTAAYMSPEQAKGKRVDRRADIWAFGAVLYEMLTAMPAFRGENVSDTLAAVLKDEPKWERLHPETPSAIRGLLRRCLRKDPLRRLHDAADVRIEIEDALAEPADAASPVSGPSKSLLYTMVLTAAVATAVATWALLRSTLPPSRPVVRSSISLASEEGLFLTARPTVAISRDGQSVAYVTTRGDGTQLYLRTLSDLEARPVEGSENASMPFFSPDGRWLGFATAGALMKVSVNGGAPVELAELSNPRGASWSEDGSIVFVPAGGAGIHRVSEGGGEPEVLIAPNRELREKTFRFPEVLPGGKALVFTLGTGDIEFWDDAAIALLSLETGEYRVLLQGGSHPVYSPTGHLIYARNGSLLAVPFDLERLELTGVPVPVLDGVITSPTKGPAAFSLSRTGSLLYARGAPWGTDYQVVLLDREGNSEPVIEARRAFTEAVPSPDGRSLALAIDNANTGVWVYDFERGTLGPLIMGFDNSNPLWAPDGTKLVFGTNRGTGRSYDIFWQAADGGGMAKPLISSEYDENPSSWSPDGTTLAFVRFRPETSWDIWLANVREQSTRPFLQTPANEQYPDFSPDGRWIAYETDESGRPEIYVSPVLGSGAKSQVSTDGGRFPKWAREGRELLYRNGNELMTVAVRSEGSLVLGKPELLFARDFVFDAYNRTLYHVMPDGEHFVMIDGSHAAPPPTELILVQNWTDELKRLAPDED